TVPYGTSYPAFSAAPSSYANTPGGDNYLFNNFNAGSSYVNHVNHFLNNNNNRNNRFELDGYAAYQPPPTEGPGPGPVDTLSSYPTNSNTPGYFNGYTQGPGYWGKTFFIWPPDPRMPIAPPMPLAKRQTMVKSFLRDFGFTANEISTNLAVQGIYQANSVPGSQNWPW